MQTITVESHVKVPIEKAWHDYTNAEAVQSWNAASEDWHCPKAENDLQPGGRFNYRMEARDGSAGFDFTGTYDEVIELAKISYTMDDGRSVVVAFTPEGEGTDVVVTFDPENENSLEMQRDGWQAILDNFKVYSETHS